MIKNSAQRLLYQGLGVVDKIGASPDDAREFRLQKNLLVGTSLMITLAAVIWGITYLIFDEPIAASIPLIYAALSLFSILTLGFTGRYYLFRFSQLLLILVLPILLMMALGGFVHGSGVILWAFLSPLGALMFADREQAVRWLLAYLGLLVLSGGMELFDRPPNNLPSVVVTAYFVMNLSIVPLIAFVMLHYFSSQLKQEQEKSERLLLNVLPAEIAEDLKDNNRVMAKHFDAVSVLFADVVGSTSLTVKLEPETMVNLLNEIFSYFDTLVDKYGLEKIRTIGDNYMVASGVPRARSDHALALANMALEMNTYIYERPTDGGTPIQFRMGMNTGPVVAGVIGQKKFHYDIWGDAVNTASRMESHGIPGKIQITQEMYEILKDDFLCIPRGIVDVKGKGEMETWFLEGPSLG